MINDRAAMFFMIALVLPACSSSPPVSFYTLTVDAPEAASAGRTTFPHSIAIGPVSIPEAVNRSQLVVRIAPNRVAVLDTEHWAEPLKNGITQLVATCLSQDLGGASVVPLARSGANTEFFVSIDVQQFESLPGEAAIIDVLWSIRRRGADNEPPPVTTHLREAVRESAPGAGYDALVAAHSRALAKLSRAIASALVAPPPQASPP